MFLALWLGSLPYGNFILETRFQSTAPGQRPGGSHHGLNEWGVECVSVPALPGKCSLTSVPSSGRSVLVIHSPLGDLGVGTGVRKGQVTKQVLLQPPPHCMDRYSHAMALSGTCLQAGQAAGCSQPCKGLGTSF